MNTRRTFLLVIFAFLVLYTRRDLDAQVHETDTLIAFSQQRITRDPEDFSNYNILASAYLQKARETGDVSYYDRAEGILKKSLALVSHHAAAAPAITYLAAVLLAKHQFHQARSLAQQAVSLDPSDPSPYAVIGDAALELGEYEQAAVSYKMLQQHRRPISPDERLSYLRFLHGAPQEAIRLMRRAVEKAIVTGSHSEHRAWRQTQLGELYFAIGDLKAARAVYEQALVTYDGYHRALAGLAKVHAAQGTWRTAIDLYQQALAVIPLPEYVAALGDIYASLQQPTEARKRYDLVEYMATLSEQRQGLYNRELALFYADHNQQLTKALALAEKELEVRRDIYTYDVLAWALYKNNKFAEALVVMKQALRLGTQDARLFFHAGMIHERLDKPTEAQAYLRKALRLNPYFHPVQANYARRTLETLRQKLTPHPVREKKNAHS